MQSHFLVFENILVRKLLIICAVLVFVTACTADTPELPTANPPEASEVDEEAEEMEEEHNEENEEEEHENESERRELGAHEHGVAELMIALSGSEVAIDLQTPAYNILGFEYAPESDEELALLEESVAALEAGELLQFNEGAGCVLASADVQVELADEDHEADEDADEDHDADEDADEDHEDEETHSDIEIAYNLECETPENIETLDASGLFTQFPNFEDVEVQWVSDTEQSATELTPENPVLAFR